MRLVHGLPFVDVNLEQEGKSILVTDVLIDTGSGASVFSADILSQLELRPEAHDNIRRISGIGGFEIVIEKTIDSIQFSGIFVNNTPIQMGQLDYGFSINGILGMDVLLAAKALIDFNHFRIVPQR